MEYITSGDFTEAKGWLKTFKIAEAEKRKIKNFILRFPGMTFYKRLCSEMDTAWMQSWGEIFMGVYNGLPGYHFSSMDGGKYSDEWEVKKYEEQYFTLEDAFYGIPEFPLACGGYEKIMLEDTPLLIIASCLNEMVFLAIKMEEREAEKTKYLQEDLGVYRFSYYDVKEAGEPSLEGLLETTEVQLVFPSFYEMFNRVTKIRISDEIIEAKSIKCN